jgi:hypothetical protein
MKEWWKPFLGCGIVIPFIAFGLFCVYYYAHNICNDELIEARRSPDKKLMLLVFTRDCGATTPYYTYVSVGKVSGSMKIPKQLWPLCVEKSEGDDVSAEWVGANKVMVHAPKTEYDYRKSFEAHTSVTVVYQQLAAAGQGSNGK